MATWRSCHQNGKASGVQLGYIWRHGVGAKLWSSPVMSAPKPQINEFQQNARALRLPQCSHSYWEALRVLHEKGDSGVHPCSTQYVNFRALRIPNVLLRVLILAPKSATSIQEPLGSRTGAALSNGVKLRCIRRRVLADTCPNRSWHDTEPRSRGPNTCGALSTFEGIYSAVFKSSAALNFGNSNFGHYFPCTIPNFGHYFPRTIPHFSDYFPEMSYLPETTHNVFQTDR